MRQQSSAPFVTIDSATGRATPTTHASLLARLDVRYPISPRVPGPVREELAVALDGFALAYERANVGHGRMYNPLTDDAYVRAVRALELALRERLGRGQDWRLNRLIRQAVGRGLLPGDESATDRYRILRENRNALAHGDADGKHIGGVVLGRAIGLIIDMVNSLYDEPPPPPTGEGGASP